MGDSGFGAAVVNTVVRSGYVNACPNLGKLLTNLKFSLAMKGAMMEPVFKSGADPKATARAWLKKNPDTVTPWLSGVTAFDGGDASAVWMQPRCCAETILDRDEAIAICGAG
ncbi:glycine betaine ABC transporter substrate-binding protein [Hyphomicrobium sp. 802]|uniref:glycine betaine ABC transporter substrate-binding protein n=1 Tax=Hyphomicrobium sp. 802 TaxID=1112272 RepID=UPI00045E85F9|nr:glycine betaine ABC transporter substrate-binding protein [Hyphomicrobium sp. 802]